MATLIDAAALESAAEYQVQAVLNTYLRQRSNVEQLLDQLAAICKKQPETAWHTLSLLDQLHRRRSIDTDVFHAAKEKINETVFCRTGKYVSITKKPLKRSPGRRATDIAVAMDTRRPANAPSFDSLKPGSLLKERYLIKEQLELGNGSTTFRAFDLKRESLPEEERSVVIRWLDDSLQSDRHAIAALQNEFAQLQRITHPNIAKAYEIHCAPGQSFIALEWLKGDSLDRVMERAAPNGLPAALALTLIREIGFALAAAHDSGVVHGSLQARNVVFTDSGELRIYGFARADRWIVAPGTLPKEHMPTSKVASPRDDLHSLALIACDLLFGASGHEAVASLAAPPKYLKATEETQWRALRDGLLGHRHKRVSIRTWLRELNVECAYWRLPALIEVAAGAERTGFSGLLKTIQARISM